MKNTGIGAAFLASVAPGVGSEFERKWFKLKKDIKPGDIVLMVSSETPHMVNGH